MKNTKRTIALLALTMAFAESRAGAAVIFQQLPNQTSGFQSDASGTFPNQVLADNFGSSTAFTVLSITFWGGYSGDALPVADNFTINFYASGGAAGPGTLLVSTGLSSLKRTPTGNTFGASGITEYVYTANLVIPMSGPAATTHWFSIRNDTGLGEIGSGWAWGTSTDSISPIFAHSQNGGASWTFFPGQDLAFVLHSTLVPAPGALALFGIAFAAGRQRRRRPVAIRFASDHATRWTTSHGPACTTGR